MKSKVLRSCIPAMAGSWLCLSLTMISHRASGADQPATAPEKAGPSAVDRQDSTHSRGAGDLQEIVVTATRREESLSKVPISITALSQESLDAKGMRDITDMVRFVPGISIDSSGTNQIAIRGIASSGGADTTGIYIDDTPIQMRALEFNPDEALPKAFDLERVEILRGPQGTLFGAGSEGGTVRYLMKQPSVTTNSTSMRSELSYTQHGEPSFEAGIAHGGPLVDNVLGIRASIWYRHDGGWIDRVDPTSRAVTEGHSNRGNTVAARLAFLFQPTDSVKMTPSVMYQRRGEHDLGTYWPAYSDPSAGRFNNATPERIPIQDEFYLPALKIQFDWAKVSLISNTSYYHRDESDAYQGTAYDLAYYQSLSWLGVNAAGTPACGPASTSPVPPCSWYPLLDANGIHLPAGFEHYASPNVIDNQQRTLTQEIRLQSNDDSSSWKWVIGGFWTLAKTLNRDTLYDPGIVPFWTALFGSSPFEYPVFLDGNTGLANYYCNGVGTPGTGLPDCANYYGQNISHDRQIAMFGEATYSLSPRWKLTAGARYAHLKFDLSHYANGLENSGVASFSGSYSENAFTPKLGVSFQADPDNLFYFTYAKGFRPGGVNAPLPEALCGATPASFESDSTQSYEIGSKNNFGRMLRLAASVYYIKWNGIQQNVYDPGPTGNCGFQYISNSGAAIAKGFDLQLESRITDSLSIEASIGYTNARYTRSTSTVSEGDAISSSAAINYSPGTTPPWTIALGPQYSFAVGAYDAFVRMDWQYASHNPWLAAVQDPRNTTQYNPYSDSLPSTSFVSIRSGLQLGNWRIAAFVDNLFNAHPVLNYALVQLDWNNPGGPPAPQRNDFTFRPRTFGITVNMQLGGS